MALDVVQFVDSIAASPTVRLDLNNEAPWAAPYEGTDFSPPRLRRAVAQTLLRDGATYPASAYDDRVLKLRLELKTSTVDQQPAALQALARQVDRPTNFLRWQPVGMTNPVFFRTIRSDLASIRDYPGSGTFRTVDVELLAEPFAYGLKQSLGSFTVANDPGAVADDPVPGPVLNANPFFETDATNWFPSGGTFARSTAQAHEGVASGLLTPDGVTAIVSVGSENVAAVGGDSYRVRAWVRCAVSRNVAIGFNWYATGPVFHSDAETSVAVTANTWTLLEFTATAPAVAVQGQLKISMSGTPLVGHTLHVDEATIRRVGGPVGQFFDVAAPLGDVDTSAIVRLPGATVAGGASLVAVRSRDLSGLHYVRQVEAGTGTIDTTIQANDAVMSGTGSNYMRCTFATNATMINRVTFTQFPAAPPLAIYRGKYRVLLRYRKSVSGDTIRVRLRWGGTLTSDSVVGDTVTLAQRTDLLWADLGVFALPPSPDPVVDGYSGVPLPVSGVVMALQAERAAGSGNLDMDVLVFVPCDEDFAYVNWVTVLGTFPALATVDGTREMAYGQANDLSIPNHAGIGVVGTFPMLHPGVTNRVYVVPNVGNVGPADAIGTTMAVTVDYWPRYLHARPVST